MFTKLREKYPDKEDAIINMIENELKESGERSLPND